MAVMIVPAPRTAWKTMNRKYDMYECNITMTNGANDLLENPGKFACNGSNEVKDREGADFEVLVNNRKKI